jgi:hypothetical protein
VQPAASSTSTIVHSTNSFLIFSMLRASATAVFLGGSKSCKTSCGYRLAF